MVNVNAFDRNKIYAVFHKGEQSTFGKRLISGIIKLGTRSDFKEGQAVGINQNSYSHCEIVLPRWIAGEFQFFSSRGTAKPAGVAFKTDILDKHPDRWDVLEIGWIKKTEDVGEVFKRAVSITGKKYAYSNVLNTFAFIRTYKDRKGKEDWWCSEACAFALGLPDYKVSPNRLYTMIYTANSLEKIYG